MSKKKENDTLKQLEKLLTDDAEKNESHKDGLTKTDFTGITIRLSVSLVLILILYFTRVFDRPIYISVALLFIVIIEVIRYFKIKKGRSRFPG